ncbi:MAG: type I restriction enzyme M protein [Candidatus Deianiraeaceae bacterium]|jgi:type I restriction enzyme M protein
MIEQDTRYIIDTNLTNKHWILDINNPQKNVFFESDIDRIFKSKLKDKRKRPDYVLFDNESKKPIGVIEAKAGGKNLDKALDQAMEYAEILEAPLIFAMNNSYCQTRHLATGKPLFINENEVNELIRQKEALKFFHEKTNEIYTIPKKVIVSRQELIKIFENLNDVLRDEGLTAGIERLNEFANVLFLKLYCEKKGDNIWNTLKTIDSSLLIDTFNSSLRVIEKKYNASVFTDLQLQKPDTLKDVIGRLDRLVFSTIDLDVIGGAFEYFLQQATATSNDLGEYFTPRHIVKTIVNLVNPQFKETIYDPFCGTGGFLTESFNYIKENTIIDTKEEEEQLKEKTIFGREITKNARLGKMNMILHGDGHSGVEQINSLENPVERKFDVVITNMPFAQKITREVWNEQKKKYEKKNNISHLYENSLAKNSGDGVCLLHCFKAVKKGGRMALVVPEGVLFRKDLKAVRKHLLDNAKLETIVSLPQGAFLPYTGVKTDILYFTNCHNGKTENKIWYFDVKNDGFSLDSHRRQIKENDLKKVDYVDFKRKNQEENILDIGFEAIDFEKIKENGYNLVGSVYRESVKSSKYNVVRLVEVCELLNGYAFKSDDFSNQSNGNTLPILKIGDIDKNSNKVNFEKQIFHNVSQYQKFVVQNNDLLVAMTGATVGKVGIYNYTTKALLNQRVGLFRCKNVILSQYLFYFLKCNKFYDYCQGIAQGGAQGNISSNEILDFQIPLPPTEEQQKIVEELDGYQNIIEGAKQIAKNWKPNFEVGEYDKVLIKDICNVCRGGSPRPIENYITNKKDGLNWLKIGDIDKNAKYINTTSVKIVKEGISHTRIVKKGSFILSNSMSFGRPYITNIDICIHDGWLALEGISSNVDKEYLYYLLQSNFVQNQFHTLAIGSTVKNLNIDIVNKVYIPLPPIHIQQEIVEQLETERKMIDSQKNIITLFEKKMKDKIDSLWKVKNKDDNEQTADKSTFDNLINKASKPV